MSTHTETLPWLTDSEHRDQFVSNLNCQRQEGQFCDVLLKIAGNTLPTHACVLSASSPVFRELIYADRPNSPHLVNAPQEIDLVMPAWPAARLGDGLEAMVDLLDYIYTGSITIKQETLDLVVKLAEEFALEGLCALIRTHVAQAKSSRHKTEEGCNRKSSASPAPVHSNRKRRGRKMPPRKKVSIIPVVPVVKNTGRGRPAAGNRKPNPVDPDARILRSRERRGAAVVACRSWKREQDESGDEEVTPDEDLDTSGEEAGTHDEADPTETEEVDNAGCPIAVRGMAGRKKRQAGASLPGRRSYVYTCRHELCDFTSTSIRAVRVHKMIHPGRSYKCTACEFFTGHCAKMLVHLREAEHADTTCSLCGEVSDDRDAFLTHLLRHDDRRLPFFCRVCEYRCRTRSHLADHEAKHAVERPFKCDECSRGFKWKTSLQTHKLSHQTTKMHLCDQCGYSTAYRNNLRVHVRKHNGGMISCAYCKYQSNCKHQLKKHEMTHAEPRLKPYICDICGQKYSHCHALRRHVRTHNPAAHNIRCGLCEFVTVRRDKLRDHGKKFHGGMVVVAPAAAVPAAIPVADDRHHDLIDYDGQPPEIEKLKSSTIDGRRVRESDVVEIPIGGGGVQRAGHAFAVLDQFPVATSDGLVIGAVHRQFAIGQLVSD